MKYLAITVLVSCGLAGSAPAAVIAGWNLDGVDVAAGEGVSTNVSPYTFPATTSEVARISARLSLGAGVNPTTGAGQYGFKIASADQTNTLEGAVARDHYLEFSLQVESGYRLHLSSIEMTGQATAVGCSNVVLMSSIDGFVAGNEIASAYPANRTGGFDTDDSGFGGPILLSSARYRNLSGTVSFRLYGWNSSSGAGSTYIRNLSGDDLILYGEVVPDTESSGPLLSIRQTNGMARVALELGQGAGTNDYVLQHLDNLAESNGWTSVSGPLNGSTNWVFEMTNSAGFYRIITE